MVVLTFFDEKQINFTATKDTIEKVNSWIIIFLNNNILWLISWLLEVQGVFISQEQAGAKNMEKD